MDKHFVYIVQCKDHSLYTGYARDVEARIKQHNLGKGAKYTKARRPVVLVYQEMYDTKSEALKREYEIKQLSRKQKLALFKERYGDFIFSRDTYWQFRRYYISRRSSS